MKIDVDDNSNKYLDCVIIERSRWYIDLNLWRSNKKMTFKKLKKISGSVDAIFIYIITMLSLEINHFFPSKVFYIFIVVCRIEENKSKTI